MEIAGSTLDSCEYLLGKFSMGRRKDLDLCHAYYLRACLKLYGPGNDLSIVPRYTLLQDRNSRSIKIADNLKRLLFTFSNKVGEFTRRQRDNGLDDIALWNLI